uniref:Uncharacterized protein n=1 Tax=Physcomitrium patens TaxID=3218 RepID=A0A2K1L4H9_PHYPA|nr:hypothetical protein PHYPA_003725 [Physcomitrium patens]
MAPRDSLPPAHGFRMSRKLINYSFLPCFAPKLASHSSPGPVSFSLEQFGNGSSFRRWLMGYSV